jgi:hypothetical protein
MAVVKLLHDAVGAQDTFDDGWEAAAQLAENNAKAIRGMTRAFPGGSEFAHVRAETLEEFARALRRRKQDLTRS